MALTHESRKRQPERRSSFFVLTGALGVLCLLVASGCYKNEENQAEEKYEEKMEESGADESREAAPGAADEEAEPDKEETAEESSDIEASLNNYAKAVAEAAQASSGDYFEEQLADSSIFEGCKATGNAAVDPLTSEELQKRFEATDRKTVLEGIEQDLPRFESEKIVEIFTDVDRPAKFHGTLEDASGEATCSLQASATIETAALIDDDEADIVRHVTNVVYDGENWRVVGLQSIAVDCDEKPMARTRACKAFQEMSM